MQINMKLSIKTKGALTSEEKELLKANIHALLTEVRPDLVVEGLYTEMEIDGIELIE